MSLKEKEGKKRKKNFEVDNEISSRGSENFANFEKH